MNTRTKAQLRNIVTDLEAMYENELTAQNRHTRQGKDNYARPAARQAQTTALYVQYLAETDSEFQTWLAAQGVKA